MPHLQEPADHVEKWYKLEPKTAEEMNDITILYDTPIHHTDREISANRPDIKNNRDTKCTLIDEAIPSDKNTSTKVSEKRSKYKDLEIEITRMWKRNLTEKFQETSTSGKFKRQHYWERHIFYGRSYSSSDNNDEGTLKCFRFKVWTWPLEKKYGIMS